MRVIFLDIDGVLNGNEFYEKRRQSRKVNRYEADFYNRAGFDGRFEIDPNAVRLLNELVKRTDAYLVLSSTWRLGRRGPNGLDGLTFTKIALALNGFEHNGRFLGKTPRLPGEVRGHEIQEWVDSYQQHTGTSLDSFVILDDDSDMAHLLPRLCWTPHWTGLTPWKCEEAERMLLEGIDGSYYRRLDADRDPMV